MRSSALFFQCCLVVVFSLLTTGTLCADTVQSNLTQYTVKITKDKPTVALVTARFVPTSDTYYMYPGANNHEKRWAKFVTNFSLQTLTGSEVDVVQHSDGSWTTKEDINEALIMSYQLNLNHEEFEWSGGIDGAAYVREDGVFLTGRSLFVINGENRVNIQVFFDVDEEWRVSNPWHKTDKENQYVAADLNDLAFGMIFAGTHKEFIIKDGQFEAIFALGASVKQYQDEFTEMAQGIFNYYVDLFGGIPRTGNGDSIKTIVVINSAPTSDGEVIGNNISILLDPNGDQMSQTIARFILVHEFFHLWNGKSFGAQDESTEWFKEGFTNYYSLKALHHVGFLDDQSYIQLFEDFFYQRYITDPGIGAVSMTEGDKKHSNWGVIYSGGMMASIAIDMMIRTASANERNLDNIMREIYATYHGDSLYSMSDLKMIFEREYQQSLDQFFENHIIGTTAIPVADYLKNAGVDSKPEGTKLHLSLVSSPSAEELAIRKAMFGILQK